jgi:hypothetical protein
MVSVRGLSQRKTTSLSNPQLLSWLRKDEASTRPKGIIRLGYASDFPSTEVTNEMLVFPRRPPWPSESVAITTATKGTTVGTTRNTMDHSISRRINAPRILSTNVSTTTRYNAMTPSLSKPLFVWATLWKRIQVATHVDKEAITKLGVSFGLTYNLISNINGSISLSLAWYIASVKVRGHLT